MSTAAGFPTSTDRARHFAVGIGAFALTVGLTACDGGSDEPPPPPAPQEVAINKTITDPETGDEVAVLRAVRHAEVAGAKGSDAENVLVEVRATHGGKYQDGPDRKYFQLSPGEAGDPANGSPSDSDLLASMACPEGLKDYQLEELRDDGECNPDAPPETRRGFHEVQNSGTTVSGWIPFTLYEPADQLTLNYERPELLVVKVVPEGEKTGVDGNPKRPPFSEKVAIPAP